MSELSPEDRRRIYEEEKARAEAQDQIKKEAQQKSTKKATMGCLGLIVGIVVILAVIGSFNNTSTPPATRAQTPGAAAVEPLTVSNLHFSVGESGYAKVTGTVKNTTSKQYGYVQVQINLYDKSGAQVGSTLANANNLAPNGTWKFEAVVLQKNADTVRVEKVSGF